MQEKYTYVYEVGDRDFLLSCIHTYQSKALSSIELE